MRWAGMRPVRGGAVTRSYAGVTLATFSGGTFSRSSNGTYLTSATAVSEASTNTLRSENRGDGYGAIPLFEGARTNLVQYTDQLTSWVSIANNTGTSAYATSPLGTTTAGRVLKSLGPNTAPAIAINIGATKAGVLSFWAKDNGSTQNSSRVRFSYTTGIAVPYTPPTTWTRYDAYATFTGLASDYVSWDTRSNTPNTGDPGLGSTIDHLTWGVQLEAVVTFPSSVIINNSGASATRSADTLTLTTAQYNAALRSVPWQTYALPYFSDTDLANGNEHWLYSFGDANSGVRIRKASGNTKVEVLSGGAVVVASSALTFSRHQRLSIVVNPASGGVTVSGATSGSGSASGSAYTFANSTLRVGGINGANNEAFCRISEPVGV